MRRSHINYLATLILIAAGSASALQAQASGSGINQWTRTADLHSPRAQACSALLPDGRMLVAGGSSSTGAVSAVELYGTDGAFSVVNSMSQARADAACVALPDGRVLVTGGNDGTAALDTAEIFDPIAGSWTSAGTMPVARQGHQAVLTPWGSVLIAGGQNSAGITANVAIYSPNLNEFQTVGTLASARADFAVVTLPKRKILFLGGTDGASVLNSVEIYDAGTGSISVAGSLLQARRQLGAAALLDGTVLIAGGLDAAGNILDSTEIFDLNQGMAFAGPTLSAARSGHLTNTLPNNGAVLITGGLGANGTLSSSELYVPASGTVMSGPAMNFARRDAASAALSPGRFLIAGGKNDANFLSSSEVYGFATIRTDQPDYAPGSAVTFLGTGWTPGERVSLNVVAFPLDQHLTEFSGSGIADETGAVRITGFTVNQSHFGVDFLTTATGSQSQAQSLFSDGDTTAITINAGAPASSQPFGTAVTFTGTVKDVTTPATIPSGTVTVTLNGGAVTNGTVTLDASGNYTFTFNGSTQFLPVRNPNAIAVVYNGNGGLGASPSQTANYTITKVAPVFTVTALPAGALPGTPITVTASGAAVAGTVVAGQVQLVIDNATVANFVNLVNGSATFTLDGTNSYPLGLAGGSHTIGVNYSGSVTYAVQNSASNQITFGVKVNTTTAITSANGASGSTIPFSSVTPYVATVTAANSGVVTGTVTFSVDGGAYVNGVVTIGAGGTATFLPSPALPLGPHVITAVYSGDSANAQSNSLAFAATVVQASTTTTDSFSPATTIVFGQPLTVTGTVTAQGGGSPSGSITFSQDGTATGGAMTLSGAGTAAFSTSTLPVAGSPHSFSAAYTSNLAGFANSASATQNVTVTAATASVATPVFVSGNVSNGQNINLSVAVTAVAPSTQTPTGSVSFFDGAALIAGPVTLAGGSASATLPNLSAGPHNITVSFVSNNANFKPAGSGVLTLTTGSQPGTVTVATPALSGTATFGQSQTFTSSVAAVQPNNLTATGTLTFFDGATQIGQPQSVTGTGPVSVTVALSGGSHNITAAFTSTNGNFANLTSSGLAVTVAPVAAKATVTSSNVASGQSILAGSSISLTSTFTGTPTPVPTGSINFVDTGVTPNVIVCSNVTLGAGVASCNVTALPPALGAGAHTIAITYPTPDQNYTLGTVTPFSFTVTAVPTKTVISASPNPSTLSQPVTLTANVTLTAPASVTPGGTVNFTSGGVTIAGCGAKAVTNGAATCSTSFGSKATLSLLAIYSGDSTTAASTSDGLTLQNNGLPATVVTSLVPTNPTYGTLNINVSVNGAAGSPNPTGTVTISENGGQTITLTLNAAGQATLLAPSNGVLAFGAGNHNLSVVYSGDANYQAPQTSSALTFTVAQAVTTTALSVGTNGSMQLTATVGIVAPGSGTPTGMVTFLSGGASLGTAALGCSGAICTASFTGGAPNGSFTAVYSGDTNFAGSTSTAVTRIPLATVTAAVVPSSPTYGSLNINVTVSGVSGSPTPTGTVTLADAGGQTVTLPLTAGQATLVAPSSGVSAFVAGNHNVTVTYSGDANYSAPSSSVLAFKVAQAATTTTLVAPNTSQTITATVAVVAPGSGAPTGPVVFSNGGNTLATVPLTFSNGGYSATLTGLTPIGPITASYSGDTNFTGSTSAAVTRVPIATVTAAAAPANPVYGALSITVTVNGNLVNLAPPSPTGTVTIADSAGQTITIPLSRLSIGLPIGTATLTAPSTGVLAFGAGTHTLTITYSGDSTFQAPATPTILTVVVAQAATTTSLTTGTNGSTLLTATIGVVAPGSGTPTGSVAFSTNSGTFATVPLSASGGVFTATFNGGPAGGTITATYSGDANFTSSASGAVNRAPTPVSDSVSISANPNPVVAGQPVTFTVNVTGAGATSAPTGSVQFTDNGVPVGSVNLVNGVAIFTTTLSGGSHNIVASYGGDSIYPPNSAAFGIGTTKPTATVTFKTSVTVSVFGQTVALTASVAGQATGVAAPGGQVSFFDGTLFLGSAPLVNGVATLNVSILAVGSHNITAVYGGDANWSSAGGPAAVVAVSKAATSTILIGTSSGNQDTLTATVTPVAPGAGIPTGTVTFVDTVTNAVLGSATLAGGTASITVNADSNPIVAIYSGDGNFLASTSPAIVLIAAVNSASYQATYAPDEMITFFGAGFAATPVTGTAPFQPTLGGASVSVTDSTGAVRPAALFFVSANQMSLVIPAGTANGPATLTVTTSAGVTLKATAHVAAVAPGIFSANANGLGVGAAQTVRVHANGTQDAPVNTATLSGSTLVAVPVNLAPTTDTLYLILYGTGIRHTSQSVTATINGQTVPVRFAGAQGSTQGLDQVNVQLPASLAGSGVANVVITVDGQVANTITVTFQ